MKTSPKVALITGVTGQDGSYLAEFLLEKGYTVHGTHVGCYMSLLLICTSTNGMSLRRLRNFDQWVCMLFWSWWDRLLRA